MNIFSCCSYIGNMLVTEHSYQHVFIGDFVDGGESHTGDTKLDAAVSVYVIIMLSVFMSIRRSC